MKIKTENYIVQIPNEKKIEQEKVEGINFNVRYKKTEKKIPSKIFEFFFLFLNFKNFNQLFWKFFRTKNVLNRLIKKD